MRTPAGSKGPNPLERSFPVQLLLPTPKKTACSSPPPRHLLGVTSSRYAVFLGCGARKTGSARTASDHCEVGLFARRVVWLQAKLNRPDPPSGRKREAARAPPLSLPSSLGRPAVVSGPGTVPVDQHSINTVPRNYTAAGTPWVSARCCYTARKCTSAPRRWRRHPRRCERALAT